MDERDYELKKIEFELAREKQIEELKLRRLEQDQLRQKDERESKQKDRELDFARQKDQREFELRKQERRLIRHKFWIGSVALVAATTVLNWQIQRREVQIKEIDKENTHLSRFVTHILDEDPLTTFYIAEYFATLSLSEDTRQRWKQLEETAWDRHEEERRDEKRRMVIQLELNDLLEELNDFATSEARKDTIREEIFAANVETSEVVRRLEALNPKKASGERDAPSFELAKSPVEGQTLAVIVHGTWAADATWWRPGGDFHSYLMNECGLDYIYPFRWSGKNRDSSRQEAALSLVEWVRKHRPRALEVYAQGHGASVAMLATRFGLFIDKLVMMSPIVREDYFADWGRVGEAFAIHVEGDAVVQMASRRRFQLEQVKELELPGSGHSISRDPQAWEANEVPAFVGLTCSR